MITGEEVSNYIRDHSVLSYNFEKDKLEQMILCRGCLETCVNGYA